MVLFIAGAATLFVAEFVVLVIWCLFKMAAKSAVAGISEVESEMGWWRKIDEKDKRLPRRFLN